jgi:DNA polymerase-3 subunit alpha
MPAPRFVHLRVHSEYSVSDSIVRIDSLVAAAATDAQGALALTDSANMFGWVKFYRAARGKGVKPILGLDAWITNDAERDRPHRLLLLVRDRTGYLNLCDLLSRAWLENEWRGRGEIRREWFDEGLLHGPDGHHGLIALSGAQAGDVGQALLAGSVSGRGASPTPGTSSCSAAATPKPSRRCARQPRSPRASGCRWWPPIRCSS